MSLAKLRFALLLLTLFILPLFFQGCLSTTRYRANPRIRTGTYVDIWSFIDAEINHEEVEELYLKVAGLMDIIPDSPVPRPQVLIVSPTQIHQKLLKIQPSAQTQDGAVIALYIPQENQIWIPHLDRRLLTHELAHYFTYHYVSVPRSKWEWIADKVVNNERVIRRIDRVEKP